MPNGKQRTRKRGNKCRQKTRKRNRNTKRKQRTRRNRRTIRKMKGGMKGTLERLRRGTGEVSTPVMQVRGVRTEKNKKISEESRIKFFCRPVGYPCDDLWKDENRCMICFGEANVKNCRTCGITVCKNHSRDIKLENYIDSGSRHRKNNKTIGSKILLKRKCEWCNTDKRNFDEYRLPICPDSKTFESEMKLIFACGFHPRLGEDSPLRYIPLDLLPLIFRNFSNTGKALEIHKKVVEIKTYGNETGIFIHECDIGIDHLSSETLVDIFDRIESTKDHHVGYRVCGRTILSTDKRIYTHEQTYERLLCTERKVRDFFKKYSLYFTNKIIIEISVDRRIIVVIGTFKDRAEDNQAYGMQRQAQDESLEDESRE